MPSRSWAACTTRSSTAATARQTWRPSPPTPAFRVYNGLTDEWHPAQMLLVGPAELHPPKDVADLAKDISDRTGARITIIEDPVQAVVGADFTRTDVWVSMGESKDVWTERVRLLAPDQVNADLMRKALNPYVKLMHCLPAFHDTNTVVGREIMKHTIKAVLVATL